MIVGLHIVGLLLLVSSPLAAGVGITAYTLGLRHAFDADHIGAIDNTTRKLMADGQRPLSVGFFFSLGHSTVVFAGGAALLAAGVHVARRRRGRARSSGRSCRAPSCSAIGLLNLILLRRHSCARRDGDASRRCPAGLMNRLFGRATRAVRKPWQMYPLGVLFGLGFDTATEIALLATAARAAAGGLPVLRRSCACRSCSPPAMSLMDTLDGAFMSFAYGWALSDPAASASTASRSPACPSRWRSFIGAAQLVRGRRRAPSVDLEPHRLRRGGDVRDRLGRRGVGAPARPCAREEAR